MTTKRRLVRKKLTQYNNGGLKRKYAAGGSQYDNNTTSAAGQGNPSTTIIATEGNPEVLQQREDAFTSLKQDQNAKFESANEEINNINAQGEVNIAEASANANAKVEGYASTVKQAADGIKKLKGTGLLTKKPPIATAKTLTKMPTLTAKPVAPAGAMAGPSNITSSAPGISPRIGGTPGPIQAPTVPAGTMKMPTLGAKPLSTAVDSPGLQKALPIDKVASEAGKGFKAANFTVDGGKQAQGIGAGIKAFKAQRAVNQSIKSGKLLASSAGTAAGAGWKAMGAAGQANVIGLAAQALGTGIKKWSSDNDETTVNAGEGIGAGVAGAGAGIGAVATAGALMGSAVPVLGTAIGAAAGALYGVGKSLFARNKARKAKSKMEREVKERKTKYNTELGDNYAQQKGMLVAQQNRMKETSGYDVGNVSVARFGGQRLRRA